MGEQLISSVVTVLTAIVGVAIIAVIVGQKSQTSNVIKAAGGAFAQDLSVAVSPVTGSSSGVNNAIFNGFTGGGTSIFDSL